jgi:hypothetical protein
MRPDPGLVLIGAVGAALVIGGIALLKVGR